MNREETLLCIIGEECSEVHQICSKAMRFGLDSNYTGETNYNLLIQEFNDLVASMELLLNKDITEVIDSNLMTAKKEKVNKFIEYSKKLTRYED